MVSFPNCKINLGLHITHKRSDGYHDLETIFFKITLFDSLLQSTKSVDFKGIILICEDVEMVFIFKYF